MITRCERCGAELPHTKYGVRYKSVAVMVNGWPRSQYVCQACWQEHVGLARRRHLGERLSGLTVQELGAMRSSQWQRIAEFEPMREAA